MKRAWCYTRISDGVGCFKNLRSPTSMKDWTEGWLLDKKIIGVDCHEYQVFVALYGEVWYVGYEATISFKHPMTFIKRY